MFLFLLARLMVCALSNINWRVFKLNFFNRRISNTNNLFGSNFIDPKVLFAIRFKALANISLITQIDASKAYALVKENFGNEITAVHQYNTFDYKENQVFFIFTIFVLRNKRIIALGNDYAEILYTGKDYNWANALLSDLANFRVVNRIKVMGFANTEAMN